MIYLMDLNKIMSGVIPVTSSEIFVKNSLNFHPEGLFSEVIFGANNTSDRRFKYSYIDLHCKILHPATVVIVKRLNRKLLDFISSQKNFTLLENGEVLEDSAGELTGYRKFIEIFDKIKFRGDSSVREAMINMLKFYNKNNMLFIDKCYVIPPRFRDIRFNDDGTFNIDEINDYYIKIIKLSEQVQSSSDTLYDILSYKIHLAVLELYEYIAKKVSKKEGLIRANILGKRLDFSARAVISGASNELEIDEIGVPLHLLVELFEPFLIHTILYSQKIDKHLFAKYLKDYNGLDLSVINLKKLFTGVYKHDVLPENLKNLLIEAVKITIEDKVVLAKRDPALHAESVQAFKPVLVDGLTIKLNPLVCGVYNADFDGDQMALYTPLTEEAIQEAKEKMMVVKSKDSYQSLLHDFSKDIVLGIYFLTKTPKNFDKTNDRNLDKVIKIEDIKENEDPQKIVYFGGIKTTIGRIIFNEYILPKKYPYINDQINKKSLSKIAQNVYVNYDLDTYKKFCKNLLTISFKYGTILSRSFTFDNFKLPKSLLDIKKKIKGQSPEKAQKYIDLVTEKLQEYLESKDTDFGDFGKAGALKGGYGQSRQVLVAKGLIQSPTGETLPPIAESYAEGLTSKDFFLTGAGTRKGIIDRVLNTADTGYLSRQLVYAAQRCEIDPRNKDCRTNRYLHLKVTPDIAKRLKGRYVVINNKIVKFDPEKMINQKIALRSPVYCTSPKICLTCYGDLYFDNNKSPYIGVMAAHQLGESTTQAIMRTFHVGGAVNLKVLDFFKEIEKFFSNKEIENIKLYLLQKDINIVSKTEGELEIDKNTYLEPDKDIEITKDYIKLEYGYFNLKLKDHNFDISLDTKVEIDLRDKIININENIINVKFNKDSVIFVIPPVSDIFSNKVQAMKHLLSGKKPFKNIDHFTLKIYEMFKDMTGCDLVHMEVLVSQLVRDKNNLTYPARLNKKQYNPFIGNIKEISAYESFLASFSFENFNKSVTIGLLYDNDLEDSIIEKLVKGEI